MDKIIVNKSQNLKGEVQVSTSKNAVLPIIAATLLTSDQVVINDVPNFSDVNALISVITCFGAQVHRENRNLIIQCKELLNCEALKNSAQSLRASFLVFGPLLARMGSVKIPFPGGCNIGVRPIDLHLKGLKAMGARTIVLDGCVDARARRLHAANIYLDYPSVGATENIMCAATLVKGVTEIQNAATEPEVVDLSNFLQAMGAKVMGAGTSVIKVEGVKRLHGCEYAPIPDRIEAGTVMAAGVMTGCDILIKGCIERHMLPVISKLEESGVGVLMDQNGIRITTDHRPKSFEITSSPYPGFPTDMQAPFCALASTASGTSIITETVFENRFTHIPQLVKMGANIKAEGRTAVIFGKSKLTGACVEATDLRAGAALIIAGLSAEGTTEISNVYYIDRGYEDLEFKLHSLGANIYRS